MRTRNGELAACTAHCQCGCEYKNYGKCLSDEDCKAQKWPEPEKSVIAQMADTMNAAMKGMTDEQKRQCLQSFANNMADRNFMEEQSHA